MMFRALFSAFVFGSVVTAAELLVVASLSGPKTVSEPPRAKPARAIVTAPPPPPPPRTPLPSPLDAAPRLSPEPAAPPTPPVETAILPNLPSTPHALSLRAALPGLTGELSSAAFAQSTSLEPDQDPVARRSPPPRYPHDARRRGIEGFVVVRMRVDAEGRVRDAVVVDSKPQGVFERSAKTAALAYRFTPARSNGQAIAATLEQRLSFRLR